MIQFRVLGGVDLCGPDGGELDSILRQPKGLALLAYLAVAPRRAFHTRESLVGLFWPELDAKDARNALTQAVHRLRRSLGPGVLVNRGAREVALDVTRLSCDAWAFEERLTAGRPQEALELYRGDLLRGLFVSGVLEFERWLENARVRLRERASTAAWGLAQAEEKAGNPGTAVHWARRAMGLSADDEAALCRLVSLLDRLGDRAGALRVYDEFAARLAEEDESEPTAETQKVIRAIRARGGTPPDVEISRPAILRASRRRGPAGPATDATARLQSYPNNLPLEPTPLIGREHELARLRSSLMHDEVRLLTLTGPGGIGKTRLALGLVAELLDRFPGGTYFVDLAPLRQSGLVVHAIAGTLGVREVAGQPLIDSLKAFLRDRALLLVLDNFERLLEAGPLVAELLASCPLVKALVTSREPLHLQEEHAFPVPALALPQSGLRLPFELLSSYAALELFAERAQAVNPEFALTESNAAAVAEICTRVEGVPLAIELAAARIRSLTPEAILARLTRPLELLKGRAPDLPRRQQSLRRTIAWSYDLLDAAEKTLFRRLAVFAGGCTPEAAQAVADPGRELEFEILEGLGSLAEKNLLRRGVQGADGEPRFGMLDTIREYALEQLAEYGELDRLRRRHHEHYLVFVEEADRKIRSPEQADWLERLSQEHDNLRAALSWSTESSDREAGFRLAGALNRFWVRRGYLSEGRVWLEALLQLSASGVPPASAGLRARALLCAGVLAVLQNDYAPALARLEAGLAVYRQVGDKRGVATVVNSLGVIAFRQGDHQRATALYEQSLELRREIGDKLEIAQSLSNLGANVSEQRDYERAAALFEESVDLRRELGDTYGLAISLTNLGVLATNHQDYERATRLHEECLELRRELGDKQGIGFSLGFLGDIAVEQGHYNRARRLCREGLEISRDVGDKAGVSRCLEGIAKAACGRSDFARAACLFGAAEALRETIGAPLQRFERSNYDSKVAAARGALGEAESAARWAEGRALSIEQAIEFALGAEEAESSRTLYSSAL